MISIFSWLRIQFVWPKKGQFGNHIRMVNEHLLSQVSNVKLRSCYFADFSAEGNHQ
jgi:hypothetical protein